MSLEIDELRNSETMVILNNTNGYVEAIYSKKEALDFIEKVKPGSKLEDFFTDEEIDTLDEKFDDED